MTYQRIFGTLLLTLLLLVACSTNFDIDNSEVNKIRVSYFTEFGSVDENFEEDFLYFEEKEDITNFVNAIHKSKPIHGDVDMPKPDYNLTLEFEESVSKSFHLWINPEYSTGTIVDIDDTATAYKLTKKSTEIIRSLLLIQ